MSAARAAARLAWRQASRNRWRSALVVAMVALPVAALAAAASVIATVVPTSQERVLEAMGTTEIEITDWSDSLDRSALANALPGARLIERTSVYSQNIVHGAMVYLPLHEFGLPFDQPPLRGMFTMTKGRAPTLPGEVALHPDLLTALHASIGDEVVLADLGLRLRITGTLSERVGIVGPDTLRGVEGASPDQLLIDLPPGAQSDATASVLAANSAIQGFRTADEVARQDGLATLVATGASFGGSVLVLFATGLIAAAAFAVGARRQLRILGLVGAVGGEPRHVRAVVLLGGTALGLVGSLVGMALGLLGAFAIHPFLSHLAGRMVGPVAVPILALAGTIALGTMAGTMAAYGPARSAARLSVVDALAGRTAPPRPPGKLAAGGVLAVVIGAALVSFGTPRHATAALTLGLLLMGGGFMLAIPLLVSWVGRFGRLLPTTARLAARGIARNGRRTGAALAAATIALALPVAISTLTLSNEAAERRVPFMASDQLVANLTSPSNSGLASRGTALMADLQRLFPKAVVIRLVPAVFPAARSVESDLPGEWFAFVDGAQITIQPGVTYRANGSLLIGDSQVLRAFHAEEGIPALEEGKVVAIGPDSADHGAVHVHRPPDANGNEELVDVPAVEAGETRFASLSSNGEFNYVISPEAGGRLGLRPCRPEDSPFRILVRAPESLSGDEIRRAKDIAARVPGAYVYTAQDLGTHNGPYRTWATAGGAVISLAILGVVLALVRAESRRDEAIMVAVGAEPRMRRRVAGANALLLAILAAVLAIPAGFLPVMVIQFAQQDGYPIVPPWGAIAVVLLIVPLVAAASAGLVSRQPPSTRLLHPIA